MSTTPLTLDYYLSLVTSQYQNSSQYMSLLEVLLQPFLDTATCAQSMNAAFSIQEATGDQLDAIGTILGISRTLPFTPTGGATTTTTSEIIVAGTQSVDVASITDVEVDGLISIDTGANQEDVTVLGYTVSPPTITADFTKPHASDVGVIVYPPSAVLGDADYRTLLMAKVVFNQFNGQYQGANSTLWDDWQIIFPGGHIYITDNQNMTATIFIVGAFTNLQQQMITNGLIVPRCQGVEFTYEFGSLPIFGFGSLNPSFVAGFGTDWGGGAF
jgi:hypothetical protein